MSCLPLSHLCTPLGLQLSETDYSKSSNIVNLAIESHLHFTLHICTAAANCQLQNKTLNLNASKN